MIKDGIISRSSGSFRDMYNETIQRWLHTIQETKLKSFDKDGVFLKTFPLVNHTGRTGYLSNGENIPEALRGSFRQGSAKFDFTIDFDMAERVLGGDNFASDVATNDLRKGRYFGFPPDKVQGILH
ncbi:unnamed protein product [Arctia plantaginis]|uniref:Uncharacterized protein n=1 Tax=Arctia plantaginis TaxID=874455 RepID=A0A8S1A590_ARCPL|nr:unnamed protein product [Arctia plantaginis]CAB3243535.1 unnamed protein product [Arctia plantaginis]